MLGAIPGFRAVAFAGLVLLVTPPSVFPVVFDRPEMLCIMAVLGQKGQLRGDIAFFFSGSDMCKACFAGILHLALGSSCGPCRQARR